MFPGSTVFVLSRKALRDFISFNRQLSVASDSIIITFATNSKL